MERSSKANTESSLPPTEEGTQNGVEHDQRDPRTVVATKGTSLLIAHRQVIDETDSPPVDLFKKLSIVDRLLTPLILITMVIGVVVGKFTPNIQKAFDTARFDSVPARECTQSNGQGTLDSFASSDMRYLSHRHWSDRDDVADPCEGSIRDASDHIHRQADMGTDWAFPGPQLGDRTASHAGSCMGHSP